MRNSKTLQKLRAGEPVKICALGHYLPPYIRHAAESGFDCIWLDLEHRVMQDREVQSLMTLFHHFDIDCMLRPSTRERGRLYRYLEDGATGLMMPHVSTPELASDIVSAIKFPPLGDRGLDGSGFDSVFCSVPPEEFIAHVNRETFLVVQIETPQAVENVEKIASIPGVTGLFVGPGDLGLRYRTLGTPEQLERAIERVAAVAKEHGKAWGMPVGNAEELQRRRGQGAQLLAVGGEFVWLRKALADASRMFDLK